MLCAVHVQASHEGVKGQSQSRGHEQNSDAETERQIA